MTLEQVGQARGTQGALVPNCRRFVGRVTLAVELVVCRPLVGVVVSVQGTPPRVADLESSLFAVRVATFRAACRPAIVSPDERGVGPDPGRTLSWPCAYRCPCSGAAFVVGLALALLPAWAGSARSRCRRCRARWLPCWCWARAAAGWRASWSVTRAACTRACPALSRDDTVLALPGARALLPFVLVFARVLPLGLALTRSRGGGCPPASRCRCPSRWRAR